MKLFLMWAAVLALSTAALAKPGPAFLSFDMKFRAEEKLLGEPVRVVEHSEPEVRESRVYGAKTLRDGLVVVFRDRDLDVVRVEFRFVKLDNNGSDPRTGRGWVMPREFVAACLKFFEGPWKAKGRAYVSADGMMTAVVEENKVIVTAL